MKTITFQSKMNSEVDFGFWQAGGEFLARIFIRDLPRNCWVRFKAIPYQTRHFVIDRLDSGLPGEKVVFHEFGERFFITSNKEDYLRLSLKLKRGF